MQVDPTLKHADKINLYFSWKDKLQAAQESVEKYNGEYATAPEEYDLSGTEDTSYLQFGKDQ
jgi:hypothetical protein